MVNFPSAWSLLAITGVVGQALGSVVSQQYLQKPMPPVQIADLLDDGCKYGLNVTMHVPDIGNITYRSGRLRVAKTGQPARWVLEKQTNNDSWHIYSPQPKGNKHYWSGLSGEEVYISNMPWEFQIKYALTNTGQPTVVIYQDENCMRFEDDGIVRMGWNTQCEAVVIEPVATYGWESSDRMCAAPGKSADVLQEEQKEDEVSTTWPRHGAPRRLVGNECWTYKDCGFCGFYERCCWMPDKYPGTCICGTTGNERYCK